MDQEAASSSRAAWSHPGAIRETPPAFSTIPAATNSSSAVASTVVRRADARLERSERHRLVATRMESNHDFQLLERVDCAQ